LRGAAQDSQAQADDDHEHCCKQRQFDRAPKPIRDQLGDRPVEDIGRAEVSAEHASEPGEVLHEERLIKAERDSYGLDLIGSGFRPGDRLGGVSRCEPWQKESNDRRGDEHQ
jgi:hypothetical protein